MPRSFLRRVADADHKALAAQRNGELGATELERIAAAGGSATTGLGSGGGSGSN
jgi:hypothetical protein